MGRILPILQFHLLPADGAWLAGQVMMDKKTLVEDSMRCPISGLLMKDPVLASDGHSYERASITKWLATKSTSPVTGEQLDKDVLVPNHQLRSEMESWSEYKEGDQSGSAHAGDMESVIPAVSSRPSSAAISSVVMEARTVSPHKAMQGQERVSSPSLIARGGPCDFCNHVLPCQNDQYQELMTAVLYMCTGAAGGQRGRCSTRVLG